MLGICYSRKHKAVIGVIYIEDENEKNIQVCLFMLLLIGLVKSPHTNFLKKLKNKNKNGTWN